ncbi:MAG: MlaD family protein [Bacteroidota bacterium]
MKSGKSVTLGLFVAVGILIFICGMYYLGRQRNLFGSNFRVSGVFKNVNGLQVGNNVRFAGINVGTVDQIDIISDTNVRVFFVIDASVQKFIKKDASAIIGNEGLMGNKIISLSPGTPNSEVMPDNGQIRTTMPVDVDAILLSVKATAENASAITADLSQITNSITKGQGLIGKLMYDQKFANNFDKTMVNVRNSSGNLNEVIVSSKDIIEATKHSFLLRRYFRKKQKEGDKAAAADVDDDDEDDRNFFQKLFTKKDKGDKTDNADDAPEVKPDDAAAKKAAEAERKKIEKEEKEYKEQQDKLDAENKKKQEELNKKREQIEKRKAALNIDSGK